MKSIAITGASGHLGNIIVKKLLQENDISIRVLIHENDTSLKDLNVTKIYGDVRDINAMRTLCNNCEVIYHCAAHISIVSHEKKKLYSTNRDGVQNAIQVSKENNAKLIYISSVEAIGKQHHNPHTEDDGFNPKKTLIEYGTSKSLATLDVLEAVKNDGLQAIIICPAGITGPFDYGTSKIGKMVQDYMAKKLPAYVKKGGFCFVDGRDVADAALAAREKGKIGQHYIISSSYLDNADIMHMLQKITDIPIPKIKISTGLMRFAALFIEPWSHISGREPLFSSGTARVLKSEFKVESILTEKELGISARPLFESFKDQVAWYQTKSAPLL